MNIKWLEPQNDIKDNTDYVSMLRLRLAFDFPSDTRRRNLRERMTHKKELSKAIFLDSSMILRAIYDTEWYKKFNFEEITRLLIGYYKYTCREHISSQLGQSEYEEGKEFYKNNKSYLEEKFDGQFIAISGNKVIANDHSFSKMAEAVYNTVGYKQIYMPYIKREKKVYRIPSPRVKSSN